MPLMKQKQLAAVCAASWNEVVIQKYTSYFFPKPMNNKASPHVVIKYGGSCGIIMYSITPSSGSPPPGIAWG